MTSQPIEPAAAGGNAPPIADAPPVEGALWTIANILGARVFPLWDFDDPNAKRRKAPRLKGWQGLATDDPGQIRQWAERWPKAGFGLVNVVCVDVDVKNGAPGPVSFRALLAELGLVASDFAAAIPVRTPSGGLHLLFAHPPGDPVPSMTGFRPGVDIKAGGSGLAVCPGSRALVSVTDAGGQREEIRSYRPGAIAGKVGCPPARLVAAIRAAKGAGAAKPRAERDAVAPGAAIDDPDMILQATEWLIEKAPPAVDGDGGDTTTFRVACELRDLGLSKDMAFELMAEHYNTRCLPPWDLDGPNSLAAKIDSAWSSAQNLIGAKHPGALARAAAAEFRGVRTAEPEPAHSPNGLITRNFADIEMRTIEWLWPGFLPKGYLTIIAGESGAGKSTALADFVARITTGAPWPEDDSAAARPARRVAWLGAEDSAAEMTKPRLLACGADPTKVVEIIATRHGDHTTTFSMQDDLAEVDALLSEAEAAGEAFDMLVIDPVTSYLPGRKRELRKVDLGDAGQLRSILEPWLRLAEKHGVAIACVTHFGKDTTRPMLHRVLGSSAFAQTCRSLLAVIQQPPGIDGKSDPFAKALLQVKTNLPEHPGGAWLFKTERVEVGTDKRNGKPIIATRLVWDQLDPNLTPDNIAGRKKGARSDERTETIFRLWLAEYFSARGLGEWVASGEVRAAAEADNAVSGRWWAENSGKFLDKRNEKGAWLCRPKAACSDASPIVVPDFGHGAASGGSDQE